ncbi:S8 family peptidase [Patulibacter minatonensis]|uniref:S8 family peptidase n=1 Tax=Patulibacter minatonensis TaxID=298163 RepID=UPI000479D686|nr:S8/S53 family peptidase [Patulibacter minatonensis]
MPPSGPRTVVATATIAASLVLAAPVGAAGPPPRVSVTEGAPITYARTDAAVPAAVRRAIAQRKPLVVAMSLAPVPAEKLDARAKTVRAVGNRVERVKGVTVTRRYDHLPNVLARVSSTDAAKRLVQTKTVASISVDQRVRPADAASAAYVGAPQLRAAAADGQGVTVAILDSGLNLGPEFGTCAAPGASGCSVRRVTDVAGGGDTDHGHGTAVASIVHEVAPAATIDAYDVMSGAGDDQGADWGDLLVALDRVTAQRRSAKTPTVVNMSLGLGPEGSVGLCKAGGPLAGSMRQLVAAGALPFAATGNDFSDVVSYPACLPGVVAVGATVDQAFSEVYPFEDGPKTFDYVPASVVAYTNISPRLDVWGTVNWDTPGAAGFNGTSAATPSVAGIAASVIGARPSLKVDEVRKAIVGTGPVIKDPWEGVSRHRVDGAAALASVGGTVTPPVLPPDSRITQTVDHFYTYVLGRAAEDGGRRHWYDKIVNDCRGQVTNVFYAFFLGQEFEGLKLSADDVVKRMYSGGLRRLPEDAKALNHWKTVLASKGLAATLKQFAAGAEFTAQTVNLTCGAP